MKNSGFLLCTLVTGLSLGLAPGRSTATEDQSGPLPNAELAKLPELAFERNDVFEATIHPLDKQAVRFVEGKRYAGFRFTVPEGLDGPVEWLSVSTSADSEGNPWLVISEDGLVIASCDAAASDASDYPRIAAQFPDARSVFRYRIQMKSLRKGARYSALQELVEGQAAPIAASITIHSVIGRFQFGDLNPKTAIPPRQRTADEVMAEVMKTRETKGADAAVEILMRAMVECADDRPAFNELYRATWNEAQLGSGRLDDGWAAMLMDAVFIVSIENRYHMEAVSAVPNLVAMLRGAGRSGRAAEVMDWWCEAQRLGGYQMDAAKYADLGAALPVLPEVRQRDIPELTPFTEASFEGDRPRNLWGPFRLNSAFSFLNYAEHLRLTGRWRESLEWTMWIHRWSSVEGGKGPQQDRAPTWNYSLESTLHQLRWMGFTDNALELAEQGLAAPHGESYLGRSRLFFARMRFELLMDLDRPVPDLVEQIEQLVAQAEANVHVGSRSQQSMKLALAKACIHTNRKSEGMALLDQLAGEGFPAARRARVRQWLDDGNLDKIEEELLALLNDSRNDGDRPLEILLLQDQAEFLEKVGRDQEELAIRRDLVRLCRSFDYFTFLPFHLAKLAGVLDRLDDAVGSKATADEARSLVAGGRLPPELAKRTTDALAALPGETGKSSQ